MHRRLVLTGLAGFAAAPALAQAPATPQSPAAPSGGAAGGVYGAQGATSPTAATAGQGTAHALGQAEQQWIQQSMMVGSVALQTSEIALQKTQDDDVKKFAKFEADEQKGMAEVLRSMMQGAGAAAAGGASPQPDQKHAQMFQKLQQANGDAFDKEYVKGQIEGHQELLQIQESFLKSAGSGGNREAINLAKLARSRIQEHIERLEDIQSEL